MLRRVHIPIILTYIIIFTFVLYKNLKKNKEIPHIVVICILSLFLFYYYTENFLPFPIEKDTIELFKHNSYYIINFIPFKYLYMLYTKVSLHAIITYLSFKLIFFVPIGFLLGYICILSPIYHKFFISFFIPLLSMSGKILLSIILGYTFKNILIDDLIIETLLIFSGIKTYTLLNLKLIPRLKYKRGLKDEYYKS